jgi:glycosyltransferase involved in cell wall biosynthesis
MDLVGLGISAWAISVINNVGPDPKPASPSARAGRPTIAFLGRLVPHKRVELLLEAAARLRVDFPDLRVRVVGRGPLERELVARSAALGLGATVFFEGFLEEREKRQVLETSWLLALPSMNEGWGLAVMEAAAVGTPAVAFRVGGLRESILDGETGLLCDDFEGFVEALRRMVRSRELRLRLGAAAAAHASHFTWETTIAGFEGVLDTAMEPGRMDVLRPTVELA